MKTIRQYIKGVAKQKQTCTTPAIPSKDSIAKLCTALLNQQQKRERNQKYAPVREVLSLLGRGAIIASAFLAPNTAKVFAPLLRDSPDYDAWKHFNVSYLHRTLRRLQQQKMIEVEMADGKGIVKLSTGGKRKILTYSLQSLAVERPKQWDGNWRLVLYDIPQNEKHIREVLHDALVTMGFYQIQESVFLFPYPCFDQIEFLREFYGAGDHLQYMLVSHIEHGSAYKTYFNLT